MLNGEEHRGTVMSIVIMGFEQYLRDKDVYFFIIYFFLLSACVYVCACVYAVTGMPSATDMTG